MPIAPEHLHLVYPGPFDAYLYGRASRDPSKKGRSVGDQMQENRELCNNNGWPIVGEFPDIDRSASRHAKRGREKFEAMIEGIEAGHCRVLVTWEASRFSRDLDVYVRLRRVCMEAGVLWCYNGTVYDLSKRADRKATAQDALQAEDEAEGIRDRNLRTVRLSAKDGKPHGRILWGYARRYDPDTGDMIEQYKHPERAPIVAEIFDRVAAGETEFAIVRDLRTRGLRLPGIAWEQHHLFGMLRNRSYIGRRIHQGKDVGPGTWPPLVELETFNAVQRILSNPGRVSTKERAIKHLLSGIARCGECSNAPHLRVAKNRTYLSYNCGNFDTSMREDKLDAYVEEAVVTWLESKAAVAAFRSTDQEKRAAAARDELQQLEDQLDDARKAATTFEGGKPKLSIASLAAIEGQLEPLIEAARLKTEETSAPPLLRGLVGQPDIDQRWEGLAIEQRRMVLRTVVNIRLHKAGVKGRRTIEPGRIGLTFVGQPGFKSAWRRGPSSAPVPAAAPDTAPETSR